MCVCIYFSVICYPESHCILCTIQVLTSILMISIVLVTSDIFVTVTIAVEWLTVNTLAWCCYICRFQKHISLSIEVLLLLFYFWSMCFFLYLYTFSDFFLFEVFVMMAVVFVFISDVTSCWSVVEHPSVFTFLLHKPDIFFHAFLNLPVWLTKYIVLQSTQTIL